VIIELFYKVGFICMYDLFNLFNKHFVYIFTIGIIGVTSRNSFLIWNLKPKGYKF